MKTIKINRYHSKRGNSYATRGEQECIDIICKKLKVDMNPKVDANYYKNIDTYCKFILLQAISSRQKLKL